MYGGTTGYKDSHGFREKGFNIRNMFQHVGTENQLLAVVIARNIPSIELDDREDPFPSIVAAAQIDGCNLESKFLQFQSLLSRPGPNFEKASWTVTTTSRKELNG